MDTTASDDQIPSMSEGTVQLPAASLQVIGYVFNGLMVLLLGVGAYLGKTGLEEIKLLREEVSNLKTEMAVSNQRIAQADRNAKRIEALHMLIRERTSDRIRGADFAAWKDAHEAREQKFRDRLEAKLDGHMSLPWHREAGAEHSETKRRLDRLEDAAKQR